MLKPFTAWAASHSWNESGDDRKETNKRRDVEGAETTKEAVYQESCCVEAEHADGVDPPDLAEAQCSLSHYHHDEARHQCHEGEGDVQCASEVHVPYTGLGLCRFQGRSPDRSICRGVRSVEMFAPPNNIKKCPVTPMWLTVLST